jgi:hypothetical protein
MFSVRFATGCDGTRTARSDATAYCTATAPVNRRACRTICCSWSNVECPVPDAGQATMSTAAAERRGEGCQWHERSASSCVPSKVQTRIHTHTAGTAKDWERRAGGEQHCTRHGMQLAAQVPTRPAETSLHTRGKQADHTAHRASQSQPWRPSAAACMILYACPALHLCMSVRRACVHPRLRQRFRHCTCLS